MSEMEESDLEASALRPKGSKGYTYYATDGVAASSSLKLLCSVFVGSFVFLATGLALGYYLGFEANTSSLWRPFGPDLAPDAPEDAPKDVPNDIPFRFVDEHFARFKRGGVRYGADYGHNTINTVRASRASRALLSEADEDTLCENRRCCHPTNGVSDEEGQQCYDLGQSDCCDLIAQDICDWNCDEDVPNVNQDHVVRDGRMRNKLCGGYSEGEGVFEDVVFDDDALPDDEGPPLSAFDLQERDGLVSEDECGDVFVDLIDEETAEYEMAHFGEIASEALAGQDPDGRRRMVVIGDDSRESMGHSSWPQNQIGLILFSSGSSTHICSGTKVTQKHVVTAAHCCHSGTGGDWYSNWRWYPGAVTMSDVSSSNEYSVSYVTAFNGWINSKSFDYDICWLHLSSTVAGYMGYGYNTGLSTSWTFDIWGYPGDKYGGSQIKWGHDDCNPNNVYDNQFRYDCDTYGGMSGSGLWLDSNNIVYGIHSYGSSSGGYNGCCRITSDKFNTMVDHMQSTGGW